MTIDEYLNLTDEEVEFLIAYEYGEPINDAFHGSILRDKPQKKDNEEPPDPIKELPEVTPLERFQDQDIPNEHE